MRRVLHLMGALEDEDIDWLVEHGHKRYVTRQTTLIREGDPIAALSILLEGSLSVRSGGERGREIAVLRSGDVVGEISFVDNRLPSASVVALQDCHVFSVGREMLAQRLRDDQAFAARFYRALAIFLADRLRATTAHLGYGTWHEAETASVDEIEDSMLDSVTLAARRFNDMLSRLRVN